jgi:hypothetical protein
MGVRSCDIISFFEGVLLITFDLVMDVVCRSSVDAYVVAKSISDVGAVFISVFVKDNIVFSIAVGVSFNDGSADFVGADVGVVFPCDFVEGINVDVSCDLDVVGVDAVGIDVSVGTDAVGVRFDVFNFCVCEASIRIVEVGDVAVEMLAIFVACVIVAELL